jgi:hypothetical protein
VILKPENQTWQAWVERKLRHPRIFEYQRATLYMPEFGLTESEIDHLIIMLRSFAPDAALAARLGRPAPDLQKQKAQRLIRTLRCGFCHRHNGQGGFVLQRYGAAGHPLGAPEWVRLKERLDPGWLYRYLRNPSQFRPGTQVRMPTFGLSHADAQGLTAQLTGGTADHRKRRRVSMTGAKIELAEFLVDAHGCRDCHRTGVRGRPRPGDVLAPDLNRAAARLRPGFLKPWLVSPARLAPGVNMPGLYAELPNAKGGKDHANFLQDVYLKRPSFFLRARWQKLLATTPKAGPLIRSARRQLDLIVKWLKYKARPGPPPPKTAFPARPPDEKGRARPRPPK